METLGVISVTETAEILRNSGMKIGVETVKRGLEQRVFPFGDFIQAEKHPVYHVYRKLLDKWIEERKITE